MLRGQLISIVVDPVNEQAELAFRVTADVEGAREAGIGDATKGLFLPVTPEQVRRVVAVLLESGTPVQDGKTNPALTSALTAALQDVRERAR